MFNFKLSSDILGFVSTKEQIAGIFPERRRQTLALTVPIMVQISNVQVLLAVEQIQTRVAKLLCYVDPNPMQYANATKRTTAAL